jgi:hypothetical protein
MTVWELIVVLQMMPMDETVLVRTEDDNGNVSPGLPIVEVEAKGGGFIEIRGSNEHD